MLAYHFASEVAQEAPGVASEMAEDAVRIRVENVCLEPNDLERCGTSAPGGGLVGTVVETGSAATAFLDARVLAAPVQACGECDRCRRGLASVCVSGVLLGQHRDGGCAEHVVAGARWLTRLEDKVDIAGAHAALAAGPALAAYALYCRAGVAPGDLVVAVGRGATKALLCALAEARGSKIVSLDGSEDQAFIDDKLGSLNLRSKPQHIFLCDTDAHQAVLQCATPGSVITVSGAAGRIEFDFMAQRELSLLGARFPHPDLMPELVAMVAKGELTLEAFMEASAIAEATRTKVFDAHASGRCLVLQHRGA